MAIASSGDHEGENPISLMRKRRDIQDRYPVGRPECPEQDAATQYASLPACGGGIAPLKSTCWWARNGRSIAERRYTVVGVLVWV